MNKRLFLALAIFFISGLIGFSQDFPKQIYGGSWESGHVQGIAVDTQKGEIYWSFTTMLVKTDFQGKVLGSITGFLGHLGCLTFNESDGKVYGSLEYKDDGIGKGILKMSKSDKKFEIGFFVAIFDGEKINKIGIDASHSDALKTVLLKEPVIDYKASSGLINEDGTGEYPHKYACSGIDGMTIGPAFGKTRGKNYLTVAYGVYGDTNRQDNDYQVLLQYDLNSLNKLASTFSQDNLNFVGPDKPFKKCFVYTGNTNWGVQNLCYDKERKNWLMFVYKGSKENFPNGDLYIADGRKKPHKEILQGVPNNEKALVLPLLKKGIKDEKTGLYYWNQNIGTTGTAALGNDLFYMTRGGRDGDKQTATAFLFRWVGNTPAPLEVVE